MDIAAAVRDAEAAASEAGRTYFQTKMGGRDGDCCGFAWVGVRPKSPSQREALKAADFTESKREMIRTFDHSAPTQGLSCKEAANKAAAAALQKAGLTAQMHSMMD